MRASNSSIAILISRRAGGLKAAIWIGAGLVTMLVAFSRVYLGVHWWTDVVAGSAVGGAWLCLLVAVTLTGRGRAVESPPAGTVPTEGTPS